MWDRVKLAPIPVVVAPLLRSRPYSAAIEFEDGVTLECGTLLREAEGLAAFLRTRIRPGDRVVMAIGNRSEFFIAWLAILAARGVAVKISPNTGPADSGHIVRDSDASLAICEPEAAQNLQQAFSDIGRDGGDSVLVLGGVEPFGLSHFSTDLTPIPLDADCGDIEDVAGFTYTSGTTGPPKGCVHDHRQYLRYADVKLRLLPFSSSDVILNPLQFYYGDSIWLFLAALQAGSRFVSVRKFSVSRFWPNVHRFGVTGFLGIGAIPTLLLKAPPGDLDRGHSVRFASQVGIPADRHQELVDRFGFPWVEGYGMSECGSVILMPIGHHDSYVGTGAIGIPVPDVEVALKDAAGETILGAGTGRLFVNTPDMMARYHSRPEATAEVLSVDGWLDTGDLVRRDDDGVYYFVGRSKIIIRRGGENIAPEEVEAVLRQVPAVLDAAVVPVADSIWGEEVKAYIETAPGAAFDPEKMVDHCRTMLSAFKVPRYFEQRTDPFPRTPSMRIQKEKLKVGGVHSTANAWDRLSD
ncbi:AMP-binding protein [Rhodococcus sp. ACPA4]|uniref:AMP-binding protein n=1 Tax=Rhodococcus sp. ACPA4 TaxID=2028571 RepID=UPI00211CF20F|nr:AMP-binding protein [Rhodococcus sp. ACPA4]